MSDRRSFYRKIIYITIVAILLLPLSWLSAPATRGSTESQGSPGGVLAQLRSKHKLSQANLGEIDPASETIKLATLGMRGVAANILWEKANHYKKTEDWTNFGATLEQITKLQPNFITVWQFQGWNLSYNVSVEFDDYRDRYYWVTRGIEYLKEGERYNEDDPRLLWDIGWFIAQKIGRADEHKFFRQLFKDDDDFHPAERYREQRDNWLVGREWFLRAEEAVDLKGKPLKRKDGKGKGELIFFSDAPMCQINYGDAIEKEGVHGEVARRAWNKAGQEWHKYGNREIETSYGIPIRLSDQERFEEEGKKLKQQLEDLVPNLREKMDAERRAALSEEQRDAFDTPVAERTDQQFVLASEAAQKLQVTHQDVADRIESENPDKALDARRLAHAAKKADAKAKIISRYRSIINFVYWRTRCEFEQTADALDARRRVFQGDQALADADLIEAKRLYDIGLAKWRIVLDRFESIVQDSATGDDLMDVIKRYRRVLSELDEDFPQDFALRDIIDEHDSDGDFDGVFEAEAEPDGRDPSDESPNRQDANEDESTASESPSVSNDEPADGDTQQAAGDSGADESKDPTTDAEKP